MFTRFGFTKTFAAGCGALVLATVLLLGAANLLQVGTSLTELGEIALEKNMASLMTSARAVHELTIEHLKADIKFMDRELNRLGYPEVSRRVSHELAATDVVSGAKLKLSVPELVFGPETMDEKGAFVAGIKDVLGGEALVCAVTPQGLAAVSATALTEGGAALRGSLIPTASPAAAMVLENKTFFGRLKLGGVWHLAAVQPVKDLRDRVAAAVILARPILSPDLRGVILGDSDESRAYTFILDADGTILLHPDAGRIGGGVSGLPGGAALAAAEDKIVEYAEGGRDFVAYVCTFPEWGVKLVMAESRASMLHGLDREMLLVTAATGAIALVPAGFFIWFFVSRAMRPLKGLSAMAERVAGGDLSADFAYQAGDEIGRTVGSVRTMVGELKSKLGFSQGVLDAIAAVFPCMVLDPDGRISFVNRLLLEVIGKSGRPEEHLGQQAGRFFFGDDGREVRSTRALKERRAVSGEMVVAGPGGGEVILNVNANPIFDPDGALLGAFTLYFDLTAMRAQEKKIRAQNEDMAEVASQARGIAESVSAAAAELAAQVEQASRGAEIQDGRTQATAESVRQMSESVLDVARSASQAAQNAETARGQALGGREAVRQVVAAIGEVEREAGVLAATMEELGGHAAGIGRIISVIQDIADQTNLLALNAAIEAARAGDAGQGFAVVADEVRKLAEKTMSATKEVGAAIANIQGGTERSLAATRAAAGAVARSTRLAGESGAALGEIVGVVEATAGQVGAIAAASQQQSAASEEISRSVDEVRTISRETALGMRQAAEAVAGMAARPCACRA